MAEVIIYSSGFCPYCTWAKKMLDAKQAEYREIRIDIEIEARQEMLARSGGAMTVPQIFVGDYHVGGYTDMVALDEQGKLDSLLEEV
jgi:glutaredoxin 3